MLRHGLAAAAALIVAACTAVQSPIVARWGDRVPTPNPSAVAGQAVLARTPTTITLAPISPRGAEIGVPYAYEMPHCGLLSPVDIDGSFWDPSGTPGAPTAADGATGTFVLRTPDMATFTTAHGVVVQLSRHAGPKTFGFCM